MEGLIIWFIGGLIGGGIVFLYDYYYVGKVTLYDLFNILLVFLFGWLGLMFVLAWLLNEHEDDMKNKNLLKKKEKPKNV